MFIDKKQYTSLIKNLLTYVPKHGWSMQALELAANKSKIDPAKARLHFHHEVSELISAYSEYLDASMSREAKKLSLSAMKIRDRVATCVILRLKAMDKHKEAAKQAAAYLAIPTHAALGTKLVAKTVNNIWYESGDTATDFNYYSKRALLSGVYISTLTYWMNDNSENFENSVEFLYRRIDNVMCIYKVKHQIKDFFGSIFKNFSDSSGSKQ